MIDELVVAFESGDQGAMIGLMAMVLLAAFVLETVLLIVGWIVVDEWRMHRRKMATEQYQTSKRVGMMEKTWVAIVAGAIAGITAAVLLWHYLHAPVWLIISDSVLHALVAWCAVTCTGAIQEYHRSLCYQHGDVVRDMYCNRCGGSLVIDLSHRIGEVMHHEFNGRKIRTLPNTHGATAWDSDVEGVVWCPSCKDGAHMYSLVSGEMWGYFEAHGFHVADYCCGVGVRVSHST